MIYPPIGITTLRLAKFGLHIFLFLDSILFSLDSTFWLDSALKLYCDMVSYLPRTGGGQSSPTNPHSGISGGGFV